MPSLGFITVGRILRPHGLKGQVEILPLTDVPNRFQAGKTLRIVPPLPDRKTVEIIQVSRKKGRLVLALEGFAGRQDVEPLLGRELAVPESEAEKPGGAFWHHEIIGCEVITIDGQNLGRVVEIIRTGVHDVYIVGDGKQYYIPAIKDVIKEIDVKNSTILIKPLPGLLDL